MRNTLKRSLSLILVFALVLSLVPGALAARPRGQSNPWLNIGLHYGKSSPWAQEELDAMEALKLIPQVLLEKEDLRVEINRLEMCAIAVLAYETFTGKPIEVTDPTPFTDTTSEVAAKAWAAGLIKGYGDGTFQPGGILTRQEFFCFVQNFLAATGFQVEASQKADLSIFADENQVASWAYEAAQIVVGVGVVKGTDTGLSPKANTTCEQALMMFYRAYTVLTPEPAPEPDPEPEPEPEPTPDPLPEPDDFLEKYPNLASWAQEELRPMDEAGLIPNLLIGRDMTSPITRKEACYVATTAFFAVYPEFVPEVMETPFSDVDDTLITTAYYLGLINGYPEGDFKPNDPITREQFFTIIGNFLMVAGYNRMDDITMDLSQFLDYETVHDYALPSTRLLCSMGVVGGSDGKLEPQSQTQCQQALAMFYRTFNIFDQWVHNVEDEEQSSEGRDEANALVDFALQFVGYPYVWGAETPEGGFDCSGLVYYVYRHFGYKIGRTATKQWNYEGAVEVAREDLLPGDLMFFHEGDPTKITHIGIYIGSGLFVHAANSTRGVVVDSIDDSYYLRNYYGAKRIIN